jgi:predicted Zn-dependent peptidase
MGTAPQNIDRAKTGLEQECQRLAETALPPAELDLAKSKLLGQYALSKQTNSQLAQTYGWYECLGLSVDFDQHYQAQVQAVTPEQLQHTAQQCVQAPSIVIVSAN